MVLVQYIFTSKIENDCVTRLNMTAAKRFRERHEIINAVIVLNKISTDLK